MIQVLVSGALGRMGTEICKAVDSADDMRLVAGVDPSASDDTTVGTDNGPVFLTLKEAIEVTRPDVVIDFTRPDVAEANVRCALSMGVNCVLGTTGLSEERLQEIYDESATGDAALFHAPNFTTGAVLMMLFAQQAAKYFPDIEVIEFHHDGKKDAPSGTAIRTARLIADARNGASDAPARRPSFLASRALAVPSSMACPVHAVRTAGYVAHQEVIFGSMGQTLTIRHDSIDRASYMPGILMATRAVVDMQGVTVGLEKLMD